MSTQTATGKSLADQVATNAAEAAAGQIAFWCHNETDEAFLADVFAAAALKLERLADMYKALSAK